MTMETRPAPSSTPHPQPPQAPYKIDEVCGFTGVKPYVLRFWETEFPEISPQMMANGQKLYGARDLAAVIMIKKLLFDEKLSIEKARLKMMEGFTFEKEEAGAGSETSSLAGQDAGEQDGGQAGSATNPAFSSLDMEKFILAKKKVNDLISFLDNIEKRWH